MNYLDSLNQEQLHGVTFSGGPLLIIAGAGTGKTTVISQRIVHLIQEKKVHPQHILALTFTEKAATEMEERVDIEMPYGYLAPTIATFHAFCEQILRQDGIHIGLSSHFKLMTETDAVLLLRKNLFSVPLNYFRPLGNPHKFISALLTHFSRLADEDISPGQYGEWVEHKKYDEASEENRLDHQQYKELSLAYGAYTQLKIQENVMDFSDLISYCLKLFRDRPNILQRYQKQYTHILVDEFQDTNISQYNLLKLLAPQNTQPDLCVVGDDNQSIYKFRGAAVSNILSFKEDYPRAVQVILNKNYRSFQEILDQSYQLISYNNPDTLESKLRISKKLHSTRPDTSHKKRVSFIKSETAEMESEAVAEEIRRLVITDKTYEWGDIAILVRANNHSENFIRVFERMGIPYQFLGPSHLFRKKEVKELISYLKILKNISSDTALFHVLSMECFDISERDLAFLINAARKMSVSLFEVIEMIVGKIASLGTLPQISEGTKQRLVEILDVIYHHLKLLKTENAGHILFDFLQKAGVLETLVTAQTQQEQERALVINQFFSRIKSFEFEHEDASVPALLEWIELASEIGDSPQTKNDEWQAGNAVTILTVHSSKGLEFPVVFVVNLVSGRFPTIERKEVLPIPGALIQEILPEGDPHLLEERRLCYVAMTRARDLLYLTAAQLYGSGKRVKKPSVFISEVFGNVEAQPFHSGATKQLSLLDFQKKEIPPQVKKINAPVITYISYTQIETFNICPLHYKLRYLLKIPTPPSPAQSFGVSIHNALNRFYKHHKMGESLTKEILLEELNIVWVREGYENKEYEKLMKDRATQYLTGFFNGSYNPHNKVLMLEENFTIPLKNNDRYLKVGGKIDRVDDIGNGRINIIDYKTGKIPTEKEIAANLQLSLYALAATEIYQQPFAKKADQVDLSLYYFEEQRMITTTRTQEQLETEKKRIFEIVTEIEASDFMCSHNQLCGRCEYQEFCGS